MRILIFAGYFYPHRGGSEDYIYRLSRGLIKRGHKINILTTNTENVSSRENKDGIMIYRLDCWNAVGKQYPIIKPSIKNYRILDSLSKNKYDFINTHTRFWITSYLGYRFAKKNKIKLIHVEHGTVHTATNNILVSFFNQLFDHTIGSKIIKEANIRIGVSGAALDFMAHLGKKGNLKISKGIDILKFKKNKSISQKNIVYTGRLTWGKGVQDLIIAFSKIKNKKINLILAGEGDYKQELIAMTKKLNIFKRVKFIGEKNEKEVINCLNSAKIFVNPSYSEGLPTTVLEAGAMGLPVIATDVGGTKEIINKNTGILIKPKDTYSLTKSIDYLLENKKIAKKLGNDLHKLIRLEYSYENMVNKFNEVYKK